jgi:hypothetical protein
LAFWWCSPDRSPCQSLMLIEVSTDSHSSRRRSTESILAREERVMSRRPSSTTDHVVVRRNAARRWNDPHRAVVARRAAVPVFNLAPSEAAAARTGCTARHSVVRRSASPRVLRLYEGTRAYVCARGAPPASAQAHRALRTPPRARSPTKTWMANSAATRGYR